MEIAMIFGSLAVAIFFRTIYTIISRYYYAQKDTRTPLYVSIVTIAINIPLAYYLSRSNAFGVVGLAIAQSIVAVIEVAILLAIMAVRDRKLFNPSFVRGVVRIFAVTGFAAVTAFLMVNVFLPLSPKEPGFTIFIKLGLISWSNTWRTSLCLISV